MIREIAYHTIWVFPLVAYLGMLTFLSFSFTAYIGYTNFKGIAKIPFKWHPRMVIISFTFAAIHIFFVLSAYLNY